MQKVIQRAARAERAANKKRAIKNDHKEKGESWSRWQSKLRSSRVFSANIKNERINRSVDWAAGSLAPRRDVGDRAETYGAMSMYDIHSPELAKKDQPKRVMIYEGDRVVVLKGRDRGKIGEVSEVMETRGEVRVKGLNLMDVIVPEWINQEDQKEQKVAATPRTVPLSDVRLVYPLPDPDTGIPRDVVIDRLMWVSLNNNGRSWDRVIPGTNTIIPKPQQATEKKDPDDYDDDTPRIDVEAHTFQPFLLNPPMPVTVIDELRNKYSRFRTRHDYNYVTRKEFEDSKVEKRKELIKGMRTPLQELAEVRRKQREAREKELSSDQLAKIGEVIAKEQARALSDFRALPR